MAEIIPVFESKDLNVRYVNGIVDYTKTNKFTEVGQTDLGILSTLIRDVPALATAEKLNGTYVLNFPEGVNAIPVSYNGGILTTMRDTDTSRFTKPGWLTRPDDLLPVISIFATLAFVTAQFYLVRIDSKLSDIKDKLNKVLDFLYTDKALEIYSEAKLMCEICQNYSSIVKNPELKTAMLSAVIRVKSVAERNIQFYKRDMEKTINGVKASPINVSFNPDSFADSMYSELGSYNQALRLYGMCSVLEIVLSENYETSFLNYIEHDLKNHSMDHNISISALQGKIEHLGNGGLLGKKNNPRTQELNTQFAQILGDNSPSKEYEDLIAQIKQNFITPCEYHITSSGTVYKKD